MANTNSLIAENFRISLQSIKSNLLRTILTILIIAIGIMALVGILTAIDAIKASINSEFTRMGANTFTIQSSGMKVRIGGKVSHQKNFAAITYRQAYRFREEFSFPAVVSISVRATGNATVKYESVKTNPNIPVMGSDDNFLSTAGHEIELGRNFTAQEVQYGRHVAVIGHDLSAKLFENKVEPLGKEIAIGSGKYKVIGVLKAKGSGLGFNDDQMCLLPVVNVRQYYSRPDMSFRLSVMPLDGKMLDIALGEAEGAFRVIRGLDAKDETDFNLDKSDNLANMLLGTISYVTIAATLIGVITLLGAAIGLMNIMLVAVSERTREIGTRKAIGATSKIIKQQFLFETILICQFGGILGIILGILIGNSISFLIGSSFIVPWLWVFGGVILCFIVGMLSGILPAIKASKLDPISALRYE